MKTGRLIAIIVALAIGGGVRAQGPVTSADRTADRAAIRAHIESIFQAFLDGDLQKIHDTHADDWLGFLEASRAPITGIDAYMRANGITWPPAPVGPRPAAPATAPAPTTPAAPAATRGYTMSDFDVQFYGPDLAVACFFGEFNRTVDGVTTVTSRLRIMDVYARRNGAWIQAASHTVVDPAYSAERNVTPVPTASLPLQTRQRILDAREAVWRAYFTNDQATLQKLIPAEAIAINEGSTQWQDRAAILAGAQQFAAGGAKLVRLEFPKTEMQVYGNVIILYTTYSYELEANGVTTSTTGRGTEMFVARNGAILNVGWHLDRNQ